MRIQTVLLVDDEPDIRLVAGLSLEQVGGWAVELASSGAEALAMLATDAARPDVILLDVMMPGLDGPAVLARLRDDPALARIPVIFLTAKAGSRETGALSALGAKGIIRKPFDPMTLAATVREIVEQA